MYCKEKVKESLNSSLVVFKEEEKAIAYVN